VTGWADKKSTLAVVIPAYNAAATLSDCLAALRRSNRVPDELILFDDGSSDDTPRIARAAGAVVIRDGPSRQGPAVGRNIGAATATSSTIVFVDADVAIHPHALGRLEAPLLAGEAVASFGSYDDRPKSRRAAALYANLRHHWVHQNGREEAFTFWSGLGAMRRDTFLAHKGFDPRFREPSIEDVDLGIRIIEGGGKICLVKDALGTHHKDWGVAQLWKTDISRRAVPWALLMKEGRGRADDLNISTKERASAVVAHLLWLTALAAILRPSWWPAPVAMAALYLALNVRFILFLGRAAGIRAAVTGTILHSCYHLYASVTFALVSAGFVPLRRRKKIITATAGRTQATRP